MDRLKDIPILHINTAGSWRGGEKQTYYLSLNLNRRGYKSYCICQKGSPLHRRLEMEGLPAFPIKMRSEFDIIAAIRIAGIARRLGAGILHMHTAHAHSLGLLSNLFYKISLNIVSRRVDFRLKHNMLSSIKYAFPELFITVSNAIKNILIEDGVPANKVITVYSGVDVGAHKHFETDYLYEEFSNIDELESNIKLVNVGALTDQKDHETLIRAAQILRKSHRNFKLFIVGEGELKNKLIKLRDKAGLRDNIIFTGFREDAINFIKFCDIFVISSRWEGLGTSIIDAMALKKPVVATSAGGIPELIEEGANGVLVEKENPRAFAEAIRNLVGNKDLQKKLAEVAALKASCFSIEKMVEGTLSVYHRLNI